MVITLTSVMYDQTVYPVTAANSVCEIQTEPGQNQVHLILLW